LKKWIVKIENCDILAKMESKSGEPDVNVRYTYWLMLRFHVSLRYSFALVWV